MSSISSFFLCNNSVVKGFIQVYLLLYFLLNLLWIYRLWLWNVWVAVCPHERAFTAHQQRSQAADDDNCASHLEAHTRRGARVRHGGGGAPQRCCGGPRAARRACACRCVRASHFALRSTDIRFALWASWLHSSGEASSALENASPLHWSID